MIIINLTVQYHDTVRIALAKSLSLKCPSNVPKIVKSNIKSILMKFREFDEIYHLVREFCSSSYWIDPSAMPLLDAFRNKYTDHLSRNTGNVLDIYRSLIKDLREYTCSFGRPGSDLAAFTELDPVTVNTLATISQKFIKLESRPEQWREIQVSSILNFLVPAYRQLSSCRMLHLCDGDVLQLR